MNEIDTLTLEFFTNKTQYKGLLEKQECFNNKSFISEKKFYKKRILDLSKRLFRNEISDVHLKNTFNSYIKASIDFLKFQDKTELIQEDYSGNDLDKSNSEIEKDVNIDNVSYDSCNNLMMNIPDTKSISMDDFIIKKSRNNPSKKIILPEKKNFDLKKEKYKTKGIKKKENINNKYEDTKKK